MALICSPGYNRHDSQKMATVRPSDIMALFCQYRMARKAARRLSTSIVGKTALTHKSGSCPVLAACFWYTEPELIYSSLRSLFTSSLKGSILPCFCDISPFLSSLFSDTIIFRRIFLRRDSLNSKMQLSFSAQERNAIPGYPTQLLQQRFSRRTMLSGLVILAGAGIAGCASLPDQTSTSASATPTATPTLPPTP